MDDEVARLRAELAASRAEADALRADLAAERGLIGRIVENAPIGVCYIDRDMVFRWANPALARFLGLDPARMPGARVFDLLPDAEPQFGPLMRGVLESGEPFTAEAMPFHTTINGGPVTTYWDFTYSAIPDAEGRPAGLLVVNIEVSARIRMLELMKDQVDRLHELDRMKGDFINAASHELRTPLTTVLGYAEFMAEGVGGPLAPEHARYVQQILKAAGRLRRLVDDILDAALIEAGAFRITPAAADLGAIAREAVESLAPQAQAAQVALRLAQAEPAVSARADGARVGQAVLNLVANAIKYTPSGAAVVVRTAVRGGAWRVEVADEGPGLPPDVQARVFEKYFRADPERNRPPQGAGLGLAIAKALVEAHGGRIGVESQPGRGATFWFEIPLGP